MKTRYVVFAAVLILWGPHASAQLVVFDNGALSGPQVGRNMGTPFTMFEDFTLTIPYNIIGFRWTQHDADAETREYLGTVLSIFESVPSSDTLIFSGTIIASRTVTDTIIQGEPLIDYEFTGLSISLDPGTYYLGLHDPNSGFSGWVQTTGTVETIPGRWQGIDPQGLGNFFADEDSVFQVLASTALPEIIIEGGTPQECFQEGGSHIEFSVNFPWIPPNETPVTIDWSLDDVPIGSGPTVIAFVELGTHIVKVTVETDQNNTFTNISSVEVVDTTAPSVEIEATEKGKPVSSVRKNGKQMLVFRFMGTDDCDFSPLVHAVVGADVKSGDELAIHANKGSVTVPNTGVTVTATATDQSGNVGKQILTLPTQ